ncbi:MAG: PKD domain-containing protein [Thermoplasmatota archaeon]
MKRRVLAALVAIVVTAAAAVPAAYLLSRKGESPAASPRGMTPFNTPPVAQIQASSTRILHGFEVTLDGSGSYDADGDALTHLWSFGDDTPPIEALKVVHNYFEDGLYEAVLTVSDGRASDNATVTITVYNGPPVLSSFFPPTELVSMDEGQNMTFGVNATDPNLDELIYAWRVGSRAIPGSSSRYTFVSDFRSDGVYDISVSVSDGHANASVAWRLLVRDLNRPPKIESVEPPMDVAISEGEAAVLRATASDPDEDTLSWVWVIDGNVGENGEGPLAEMTYRPDFRSSGAHSARVTFSDGSASASNQWSITVRNTNLPPEIAGFTPDRDVSFPENSAMVFVVTALDPDGDPMTFDWTLDGAPVGSRHESHYTLVTNYSSSGSYRVSVVVSDGRLNVSNTWNVTVTNVNRPPTARASASALEDFVGAVFEFDAGSSYDPDGEQLSFEWDFGDGGLGAGVSVTHVYSAPGGFRVTLTARDPFDGLSMDSVDIRVLPGLSRLWGLGPLADPVSEMLVRDIDADGLLELVAALDGGEDGSGAAHGRVLMYGLTTRLEEWRSADIGRPAGLAAANLDGDPALEILVGLELAVTGDLYGTEHRGALYVFDGATHALERQCPTPGAVTSVLIADTDLDERKEILLGYIYNTSIDAAGGAMTMRGGLALYDEGLNQIWNSTGWGLTLALACENLDRDPAVELVLATLSGIYPTGADCNLSGFEWSGGEPAAKGELEGVLTSAFDIADINGDGVREVLAGESELDGETGVYGGRIYALDPEMSIIWRSVEVGGVTALEAADIDGRPGLEICAGVAEREDKEGNLSGRMLVFESTWIEGWRTGDIGHVYRLAAGDADGDGVADVAAASMTHRRDLESGSTTLRIFSGVSRREIGNASGLHELTSGILLADVDVDASVEILVADWMEAEAQAHIYMYEI